MNRTTIEAGQRGFLEVQNYVHLSMMFGVYNGELGTLYFYYDVSLRRIYVEGYSDDTADLNGCADYITQFEYSKKEWQRVYELIPEYLSSICPSDDLLLLTLMVGDI